MNKKYSLDERAYDNYSKKLQEFTQEGTLEQFKSRKYSMQTDKTISDPACTPVYSHNYPLQQNISPFYFHNNGSSINDEAIDSMKRPSFSVESNSNSIINQQVQLQQVEPQTIQIVEEVVIPNYRQQNNSKQQPTLFNPSSQQNQQQIICNQNIQSYDNCITGSFHSNQSTSSLKSSFLHHGNIYTTQPQVNMQNSFSVPSCHSSLVQSNHQKGNSQPNVQLIGQQHINVNSDKQLLHSSSSGVQSVVSQSLPCQCTQCLQAQMAYLQSLLIQQQQLYLQQTLQEGLNESQSSNSNLITLIPNSGSLILQQINQQQLPLIGNINKQSIIDSKNSVASGSCPSHVDDSIPDEILSLKSDDQNQQSDTQLDREQRIIRDQIELQRHYENYIQQEQLILEQLNDEVYRARYLPELNIDPNPQQNILKKNYIELPLGEIPEMKESFYEDQSRYTNSSMSKKLHRHSVFGSQALSIHEYNNVGNQQNHLKLSNQKHSMRQSTDTQGGHNVYNQNSSKKKILGSNEKDSNKNIYVQQVDYINESFPILRDHNGSRNQLHSRNLSQQNPSKSSEDNIEKQSQFNHFETVVTPHKQRQLSGSNWGTTINRDQSVSSTLLPHFQQSTIQQTANHHRRTSSLNSNQQLIQVLESTKNQENLNQILYSTLPPRTGCQLTHNNCESMNSFLQSTEQKKTINSKLNFDEIVLTNQTPYTNLPQKSYQIVDGSEQQNMFQQDLQQSLYKDIATNLQKVLCQSNTKVTIFNECQSHSFERQLQQMNLDCSSAKKDLSSSLRNQSYERDQNKTDKLINYILDQDSYYHQSNSQNSGSRTRPININQQRNSLLKQKSSAKKQNENSINQTNKLILNNNKIIQNCDKKATEQLVDGNYFYKAKVDPLCSFDTNSQDQRQNKEDIFSNTSLDYQQITQYNKNKELQIAENYYNDNQDSVQRVLVPLYNQQSTTNKSKSYLYVFKEARSRSVEPRNGRIFQKYNALKHASSSIKRAGNQYDQKRTYSNPRDDLIQYRGSSVPSQQRQPLIQFIEQVRNQQNNYGNKLGTNNQISRKQQRQSNNSNKNNRIKDQQQTSQRLTYSGQRGKNQKKATQKSSRQNDLLKVQDKKIIMQQSRKQQSIFERLATQGISTKKARIENSLKEQNSQSQNSQQSQSQINGLQFKQSNALSKKYAKTLFEMSELPSIKNIQRSISAKRQQNQLIVSLAKRKTSVQSNTNSQNDQGFQQNIELYNMIKNKDYYMESREKRKSIESQGQKQVLDSISKKKKNIIFTTASSRKNSQPKNYGYSQAYSARQTKSSSLKRQTLNQQFSQTQRNNQQRSSRRDPKYIVINLNNKGNNKKNLFSQSVEKPPRTLYESQSPPKTQKKPLNLQILNQQIIETPSLTYYQNDCQLSIETPEIRQIKFSNPSFIQTQSFILEGSLSKERQNKQTFTHNNSQKSAKKSDKDSSNKNPFQNSNLASYRESFLIVPNQQQQYQQPIELQNQEKREDFDQKAYKASLYQQIISSQVFGNLNEDEDENEFESQPIFNQSQLDVNEEEPERNEIEYIISENHKQLNVNKINDIQQNNDLQKKINEYYKLKEQQEKQIQELQSQQAQLQIMQKEQNSKDLQFILNQLEGTERSRVSTVQGFASFNTLEQQEFLSFNSFSNPYQMPKSLINTMDRQPLQQSTIYNQKTTVIENQKENRQLNNPRQFDSGQNLIQTPGSKQDHMYSDQEQKKPSTSSKQQQENQQSRIYSSPKSKRKSFVTSQQENQCPLQNQYHQQNEHSKRPSQNFCLPNALFFKKDAVKYSSESVCNVGEKSGEVTLKSSQLSNKSSRIFNDNCIQSGSDVEVLRQSTDNSPSIIKKKEELEVSNNKILNQSISNSKNETSIIIKSFGVDAPPINSNDDFHKQNNMQQPQSSSIYVLNQSLQQSNSKPQRSYLNQNKRPNIPPPKQKQYDSMKISNVNSQQVLSQMTPQKIQESPSNNCSSSALKQKVQLQDMFKNQSQKSSNSQLSQYKADDEQTQNNQSALQSTGKKFKSGRKNTSGERSQFRTLKLSQDEKQILRERVEQHRKSLNRNENSKQK